MLTTNAFSVNAQGEVVIDAAQLALALANAGTKRTTDEIILASSEEIILASDEIILASDEIILAS